MCLLCWKLFGIVLQRLYFEKTGEESVGIAGEDCWRILGIAEDISEDCWRMLEIAMEVAEEDCVLFSIWDAL